MVRTDGRSVSDVRSSSDAPSRRSWRVWPPSRTALRCVLHLLHVVSSVEASTAAEGTDVGDATARLRPDASCTSSWRPMQRCQRRVQLAASPGGQPRSGERKTIPTTKTAQPSDDPAHHPLAVSHEPIRRTVTVRLASGGAPEPVPRLRRWGVGSGLLARLEGWRNRFCSAAGREPVAFSARRSLRSPRQAEDMHVPRIVTAPVAESEHGVLHVAVTVMPFWASTCCGDAPPSVNVRAAACADRDLAHTVFPASAM